jgi:TPR repeat protein
MRILFATLFMSLCLVAPLSAEDIDAHPGFKLVVSQLKAHQRFTPEFVNALRPQAEKGDRAAIAALALTYIFDQGIPRDEAESIRWVEKAWQAGDADVVYSVGMMYKNGELYPKDAEKSFLWVKRAMEMGHPDARYFVGFAKERGLGVPVDLPGALKLYQEGAEQLHPLALERLGRFHREGKGVPKDSQLAFRLWMKGAEAGHPLLQSTIGLCYLRQPDSFPNAFPEMAKDDIEAYKWLTLAIEGGFKTSAGMRNIAARRMSVAEIKEAIDKAAAFRPTPAKK